MSTLSEKLSARREYFQAVVEYARKAAVDAVKRGNGSWIRRYGELIENYSELAEGRVAQEAVVWVHHPEKEDVGDYVRITTVIALNLMTVEDAVADCKFRDLSAK